MQVFTTRFTLKILSNRVQQPLCIHSKTSNYTSDLFSTNLLEFIREKKRHNIKTHDSLTLAGTYTG